MTQASKLAQIGSPGVSTGFKNKLINGAMMIDQRNAGAAVTGINSAGFYTVDRWKSFAVNTWGASGVVFTAQQNKGSVTPPTGFKNYLGISPTTGNASLGATVTLDLTQVVEGYNMADLGWGTSSAKTVTLSFWVYSNLTGTFGGSVVNSAYDRSYIFSYTISAANTWEYKTITIAGDTAGTWLSTNGIGANISFSLGAGSSMMTTPGSWNSSLFSAPTGQQQICASTSNNFYITGVQLEVGTTATEFEYVDYGRQLAQCQRYYYMLVNGASQSIANGFFYASNSGSFSIQFPVTMRSTPSLSNTAGSNYYAVEGGGYTRTFNGNFTLDSGTNRAVRLYENSTLSSVTAGQGNWFYSNNASSFIAFSAEL